VRPIAHEVQLDFPLRFVRGEGKGEESENGDFLRMNSNTGGAMPV